MNLEPFISDSFESRVIASHVPEITKNEPCCLGIDEAGRGPVLGPMVYGICYCPVSLAEKLANLGFADSKTLTEEARDNLLKIIEENLDFIGWSIKVISPTTISTDMLRRCKISLNTLSHDAAIELTQKAIADGANVTEMYVDTVGTAATYQAKLEEVFPGVKVVVQPKADADFPIVSAASICAKVARDRCIKSWIFQEGDFPPEYGSGYPADPKTKQWLKDIMDPIFGFPQFVRFSWSTCSKILEQSAPLVRWEDDDEEEGAPVKMAPITSFFAQKEAKAKVNTCKFFVERRLVPVCDF